MARTIRSSTWGALAMVTAAIAGMVFIPSAEADVAAAVVTVDGTSDLGLTEHVASGFLHHDALDPALAHALKPHSWRMGGYWGEFGNTYDRARIHGAKVMWLLSDDWSYSTGNFQPWLDWAGYEAWVRWTVKRHLREFPVEWWDIQNEPEYSAPPNGTKQDILDLYLHGYRAIHEGYAEFVAEEGGVTDVPPPKVVGPSISALHRGPFTLDEFLDFAAANDMRLSGITWHELCAGAPPEECPLNPHDIVRHTAKVREMTAARGGVLADAEPMINEYTRPAVEDVPGQVAGAIAAVEFSNVLQANHTCWGEPVGGNSCFEPRLNGLVGRDGRTPRDSYWVYKAYADMVGNRLTTNTPTMATTPPSAAMKPFSAYATHDAPNQEIRVLLGRHETRCSSGPNLYCTPVANANVPAPVPLSVQVKVPWDVSDVTVRRQRLGRPAQNHAANPSGFAFVDQVDVRVAGDGTVAVPIEAFGDGEAWSIVVDAPRSAPLPVLSAPVGVVPTHFCAVTTCVPTGPVGSWSSTGSMYFGLSRSKTAVLGDGRVLQSGGYAHNGGQHNTRIYDHVTGTWNVGATMLLTRLAHTLTTLADGRVLAVGGEAYAEVRGSAELFDPVSERWQNTDSLLTPRYDHTATRLPDGRVLVAGGWTGDITYSAATPTAEIYDPATETWTATGALTLPRAGATATLLPGGKVLVAGGAAAPGAALSAAEVWDPSTGRFTFTGSMSSPRSYQTASALPDGTVLIAGGGTTVAQSEQNTVEVPVGPTAEIYDPVSGAWRAAGSIPGGPRTRHTASTLTDGRVLLAGGVGPDNAYLASTAIFDPSAAGGAGAWAAAGALATTRAFHTATTLPNGNVLVAGGEEASANDLGSLGRYNFMKVLSSAEVFIASSTGGGDPVVPESPGGPVLLLVLGAAGCIVVLATRGRRSRHKCH